MVLTLYDVTPVGLCIATQDLFDAKRFQLNFCDNLLLRGRDSKLGPELINLKRELNSPVNKKKFLDGHKTAIINNIDKILGLISSRYAHIDLKSTEKIIVDGKDLIGKVMFANSFEEISTFEPVFKSRITLPVYELFLDSVKKSKV